MSVHSDISDVVVKYTGSALPGNAEVVVLFNTVTAGWAANGFSMLQMARFLVSIPNSQAGALDEYRSIDRGVTWVKVSTLAVAAAAANTQNFNDYLVGHYADWKLEWTNGATPQTVFGPSLSMTPQRTVAN